MKYFEPILNKLTKKVMSCPSCQKRIRIPIKVGKTLRVTCPSCHTMFDISFKNNIFTMAQYKLFNHRVKQFLLYLKPKNRTAWGVLLAFLLGFFIYFSLPLEKKLKQDIEPSRESSGSFYEEI